MTQSLELPPRLVVPLFPLPKVVLFPGARLPLYIFEPRYKQMVEDTLAEERYLSVTLLAEQDGEKAPTEISGLGQITQVERLPKDEKNIVVTGLARVRLLRQVSDDPYISAEVEPLKQTSPEPDVDEQLFIRLREATKTWLFRMRPGNIQVLCELGQVRSLSGLCDFFGAYLLDDPPTRQKLLEELDVEQRAGFIIELVKTQLYRYSAPFEN